MQKNQFEDYPYSCSYPTHRGALAAASLRLWCPSLNFTPELYRGSRGGCPDGLVAYANPPLGKYWMPAYFQVTQLLEYALATPVLTEAGFTYWDSDGAMFADPDPEREITEFLKRWRGVTQHRPVRPLKAMVFLTDYPDSDERLSPDFDDSHAWSMFYNISEANQCQLYRAARESGLNVPTMSRLACLDQLDSQMTDTLVLPSLEGCSSGQLERLRQLYADGVALVASSSVKGLEDIFGVQEHERTVHLNEIKSQDGRTELVQPVDLELHYTAADAQALLYGSNPAEALILQKDRALLLNCALPLVGVDTFMDRVQYGRESISQLLFAICQESLLDLARPLMQADCGLSAYSDGANDLVLLLDYSPMQQIDVKDKITSYKLTLPRQQYKTATCDYCEFAPNPIYAGDFIKEIHVRLRPQETMLIKLAN